MPTKDSADKKVAESKKTTKSAGASLIDSHCHLHDRDFYTFPMAVDSLHRAKENSVDSLICIGTSLEDSMEACGFAFEVTKENAIRHSKKGLMDMKLEYAEFPKVSWTFGIHPEQATSLKEAREMGKTAKEMIDDLFRNAYTSKISDSELSWNESEENPGVKVAQIMPMLSLLPVGIGEIGLDYHGEKPNRMAQIRLLEELLQIADKYNLPVSFHVREAFDDFFPLVANFPKLNGVVHSFSDNKKNLRRVLEDTRFYIGVNGMATYSTLPTPPLERILLETDAPFLTPKPFRGIINEPGYVRQVAEWLAAKLGQSYQSIAEVTTENARRLFNL